MQIDKGFADVNGTRLYYEVAGSGHPLVLMYGFSLDTRMWDGQFEVFAQQYRVLRYDARGFGQSALPTKANENHSDDLRALMNDLGLDSAHLVGLSMGGRNAINFALDYPDATDTLLLADAGVEGFPRTEASPTVATMSHAKRYGLDSAKAFWLRHALFAPAHENQSVASQLRQMVEDYSGWHWLNATSLDASGLPAVKRLHMIEVPTLVIVGERDLPDYHDMAETMATQIPDAKKIVIPKVGHLSNMEASESFNELVLEFFAAYHRGP